MGLATTIYIHITNSWAKLYIYLPVFKNNNYKNHVGQATLYEVYIKCGVHPTSLLIHKYVILTQ